jgi:cytochrome P450
VGAGIYTLHHNASSFPSPYSYDINRWITQQDENEEEERMRIRACQRAFAPFSTGPRQCIAKNFAVMELMLTMAHVVWRMDFESVGCLGEGGVGGREFQLKSFFTSHMEGPVIRFKSKWGTDDG